RRCSPRTAAATLPSTCSCASCRTSARRCGGSSSRRSPTSTSTSPPTPPSTSRGSRRPLPSRASARRFADRASARRWADAAAVECHGGPAVARDDRAIRPEALAERVELPRRRRRVELPRKAVAAPDAEVVDGPDVEPAQLEEEEHLRAPAPDPADGRELGGDSLVGETRGSLELDAPLPHLPP